MKPLAFAQLVRWPNLLIVMGTMYLLHYALLRPAFLRHGIETALPQEEWFLFVMATVLVTAAGNIINDIRDRDVDTINRPHRLLVGKSISLGSAYWMYFSINIMAFVASFYLALYIRRPYYAILCPLAVFLLWSYSAHLKRRPFVGNLLIALFCVGVPALVWLADREQIQELIQLSPTDGQTVRGILLWYIAFALISTLYRELIKDLEDQTGDTEQGYRTLPIVLGTRRAKAIALLQGGILLVLLSAIPFWQYRWAGTPWPWLLLAGLVFFSLYGVYRAQTPAQFHRLSLLAKLIMGGGLILLTLLIL